jgi:hypothetical protein
MDGCFGLGFFGLEALGLIFFISLADRRAQAVMAECQFHAKKRLYIVML